MTDTDYVKLVEYTEKLAMLEIPSEQKKEFAGQIGEILHFVEKLNSLDTSSVKATAHILPVENVTRKDEVKSQFSREDFLKLAPEHDGVFFKVPAVIQEA